MQPLLLTPSWLQRRRPLLAEFLGASIVAAALAASFLLRFEFAIPAPYLPLLGRALGLALAVKLAIFRLTGLRHLAWRHLGFEDLLRVAGANTLASVVLAALIRVVLGPAFPRSIYVLDGVLCLMLEVATRAAIRMLLEYRRQGRALSPAGRARRRVLIFGAGCAGVQLARELRAPDSGYVVVGLLDDDPAKRHMRVHGLRVLGGRSEIGWTATKFAVDEILVALPRASGQDLTAILERCHAAGIGAKRVPALAEMVESRVLAGQLREVRIEDLLGRPSAAFDAAAVRATLEGEVVLITGAGGSIGSELCRQIARHRPAAIVGFDHAETALYDIEQEMAARHPGVPFRAEIGNLQNRRRLDEVFERHRPRRVYHAAAYKHVPLMETHMFEAVANNVFGTRNVMRAAARSGAASFVMISSDKAVRPANIMGATKRIAELVCLLEAARPATSAGGSLRSVAVRFGNVLGSSGSVIPRFRRQIAGGGPVTVTHPEIRRYFMTIPEAAQLVLDAGTLGAGGEIFVLDMGEPVRIVDLARKLILLGGQRPDIDIPIAFTGLRQGEKLYEELSAYEEHTATTPHPQIRVFTGPAPDRGSAQCSLRALRAAVKARDAAALLVGIKELVPDYNPSNRVLREALERPPVELPPRKRRRVEHGISRTADAVALAGNAARSTAHAGSAM